MATLDINGLTFFDKLLKNYKLADYADASNPTYVGAVNTKGHWYIKKIDDVAGTIRWTRGDSDYPTNWTNRASLSYDYLYNVFDTYPA